MTGLRTVGGGLPGPYTVTTNLFTNPNFRATSGSLEQRRNLALNPSNEAASVTWLNNNGAISTHSLDTTVKRSGTQSLKSTPATTGTRSELLSAYTVGGNNPTAAAGDVITASVYVAHNAATTARAYMTLQFLDSGNGVLQATSSTTVTGMVGDSTFNTRLSHTATAPANTVSVRVLVFMFRETGFTLAGEAAWADDCLIEKTDTVFPYFDGNTAAANDLTYSWTGTVGNSPSIATGTAVSGLNRGYGAVTRAATGGGAYLSRPTSTGYHYIAPYPDVTGKAGQYLVLSFTASSIPSGVRALVEFYTSGSVFISGSSVSSPITANTVVKAVIPAGAAQASVYLSYPGAGGFMDMKVSNVVVEVNPTGTVSPYFDGNTMQDATTEYRWTGTVDGSTSEKITRLPFSTFAPDGTTLATMQKVPKRVNGVLNPVGRAAGGLVQARKNWAIAPNSKGTTGTIEVRRNYCPNPQPTTATGWASVNPSVVPAPWDSSRSAFRAVANGSATAYIFSAGAAFLSGQTVTVSATVQLPVGCKYRLQAHVRTGNAYLSPGPSLLTSDGTPKRVSHTVTLTADAPDLDTSVLFYNAAGGLADAGTECYVGDVLIERATTLGSYFDGGTTGYGDNLTCSWTGTVNNSASVVTGARVDMWNSPGAYRDAADMARMVVTNSTNGSDFYSYNISAATGSLWSMRIRIKRIGSAGSGNYTVALKGTTAGAFGTNTAASTVVTGHAPDTVLETVVNNFTVGSGADGLRVLITGSTVGTQFAVENVIIENHAYVGNYFDGSTPTGDGVTYAWSGVADRSASVMNGNTSTSWSGSLGARIRGPLSKSVDSYGTTTMYTLSFPEAAVGEYWSGRVTVSAIPGMPATNVQARIHDGLGYVAGVTASTTIPADGSPVTVEILATSPATAATNVRLYVYPSQGHIRVLEAHAERVTGVGVPAGPSFNGASPADADYTYAWSGTPDTSTSLANP